MLKARFVLWQHRRHNRLVIEREWAWPIVVLPGVFNPTLFRTTPIMLDHLETEPVSPEDRILDLCTGTGIYALAAAGRSKNVVAADIDPTAVRCARINGLLNQLEDRIEVRQSDLFENLRGEQFDLILCNPPFFEGTADCPGERPFYAGSVPEDLARALPDHLTSTGRALVVLSSDGAEARFVDAFHAAGLICTVAARRNLISEVLTLYRIQRAGS